VEDDKKLTVTV